ncbi:lipid-binding protein [uncultured Bacteroides sp.]|uniref:lipid-binding protein n=1 Tax=uncultured Bacteroides sp. TaxID=162156 RepID=UPI002AA84D36|nr:lipid-binding protein [uncultured Bacteroides sp.]
MRILKFIIVLLFVGMSITSCQPTYDKQYSWAYPVAGDWACKAYVGEKLIGGPYQFKIYNTSMGQDSIWFDDYAGGTPTSSGGKPSFWQFKIKAAVDMSSNTFQTTGSISTVPKYAINIVVSKGQIIKNDSIYMEVKFQDDPNNTYILKGHRANTYDDYEKIGY